MLFRVSHFQSLTHAYTRINLTFTHRSPYNAVHSSLHQMNGCFQFGVHILYGRKTEYYYILQGKSNVYYSGQVLGSCYFTATILTLDDLRVFSITSPQIDGKRQKGERWKEEDAREGGREDDTWGKGRWEGESRGCNLEITAMLLTAHLSCYRLTPYSSMPRKDGQDLFSSSTFFSSSFSTIYSHSPFFETC